MQLMLHHDESTLLPLYCLFMSLYNLKFFPAHFKTLCGFATRSIPIYLYRLLKFCHFLYHLFSSLLESKAYSVSGSSIQVVYPPFPSWKQDQSYFFFFKLNFYLSWTNGRYNVRNLFFAQQVLLFYSSSFLFSVSFSLPSSFKIIPSSNFHPYMCTLILQCNLTPKHSSSYVILKSKFLATDAKTFSIRCLNTEF